MKDFRHFKSKEKKKEETDWTKEAERIALEYDGMSEGDLLKAVYERAAAGRREGTLTDEQIDAFYEQFAPMLDGIKLRKLKKIVAQLKEIR